MPVQARRAVATVFLVAALGATPTIAQAQTGPSAACVAAQQVSSKAKKDLRKAESAQRQLAVQLGQRRQSKTKSGKAKLKAASRKVANAKKAVQAAAKASNAACAA